MKIVRGDSHPGASSRRSDTFVGEVWADPVLTGGDGITISSVFFAPGARTHWHSHEHGQVLQVTAGAGWVCARGGRPEPLAAGDVVWAPAGEVHWHGAGAATFLLHTATSLGATSWGDPVSDDDGAGHRARGGGSHA